MLVEATVTTVFTPGCITCTSAAEVRDLTVCISHLSVTKIQSPSNAFRRKESLFKLMEGPDLFDAEQKHHFCEFFDAVCQVET